MGRIRDYIEVDGQTFRTLFDSGSRNTYVTAEAARGLLQWKLAQPQRAALGGTVHTITDGCILSGMIQGLRIETHARIIPELGEDEAGQPIHIIFGALAMQEWGIRLVPEEERLDLTHYPKEFVEY